MLKEFLKNKYNKLNLKEFLEFAKNIANTAGDIMRHYFNSNNGSYYKNDNTIVTKADNEINQYLIDQVKKAYPTHSVDGEEQQFGKSKFVWVCDPIDGTAMYARNIPTAVFSLAFVVDGVPVVGVILDPWTNTLYSAIKGNGAFANDKKIIVNDTKFGDKSSVSHFDNVSYFEYDILDLIKNFIKKHILQV